MTTKNFLHYKNYQLILATNLLTSLWSGCLFWDGVKKSRGEGRKRVRGSQRFPSLSSRFFHPFPKQTERQPDHRLPFNTLFKPMLLYTSEVWGTYDKRNFDKWEQDPVERLHCQFYKYFLGLNKRASNVVAWNDKPTIYLNILKFRQHLEELPENSIAEQCLIISKELAIPSSVYQICSQFCKEGKNTTGLDDIQQINKLEISKLTKKYS